MYGPGVPTFLSTTQHSCTTYIKEAVEFPPPPPPPACPQQHDGEHTHGQRSQAQHRGYHGGVEVEMTVSHSVPHCSREKQAGNSLSNILIAQISENALK